MSLQTLCERILADSESEAHRIEAAAASEASRISADAQAQSASLIESTAVSARIDGETFKKQRLAGAKLEARDTVVAAKQDLIDEAFSVARDLLSRMSDSEYIDFVVRLIDKHAAGGEEALFDEDDTQAKKAVEAANAALESRGLKPVSLGRLPGPLGRGFILRGEHVEENFSLDSAISAARERLETDVADIIFSSP